MTKKVPTIGRTVWFKGVDSDTKNAAIVCYVWNENMVNLVVFDNNGYSMPRTSVEFFHGDIEECPVGAACWPTITSDADQVSDFTHSGSNGVDHAATEETAA